MGIVRDEDRLSVFFKILSSELSDFQTSGPKRAAVDRQLTRMRKRALFDRPQLATTALEKFKAINEQVRSTAIRLDSDIVSNAKEFILSSLERYTTTLDEESVQMPMYEPFLYDNWRFGPGASNGVRGTHTAEKIGQDMTCTVLSKPLVRKLRSLNTYFRLIDGASECGVALVDGSRMTTVPKNEDTVRTIAIEPSGNMALQLAAGRYLENTLRYVGLDISCQQPKNKALALIGSIDGSFATIDLSSASDMISPELVRLLFPPCWYSLFVALRSHSTELPTGEVVQLHMMSTMGNGFTFPLMTFLFAALLYAYRCRNGGPRLFVDWGCACVFGDDIIVKAHEYDGFVDILGAAGFVVNADKSYSAGPFRESCGGDYFEGVDITPFYVKSLSNDSEVYVAINQLLEWSGKLSLAPVLSLLYLKSLVRKVLLVPEWCNPDQGLLTSRCPARYSYLSVERVPRRRASDIYDMPLAVGGYVEQSASHLFYTPRSARIKVRVRRSRLPNGYLDGWCADKRTSDVSCWIGLLVDLTM